jgi:ATP-binding cassette, subfamily F, member 3
MIQLSALSKTFGDRVLLDAVSWQIDDRERVGLSGPNGAGKTTLLKMLAGLEEPDSGHVIKPSGLTVGYLPQDGLNHSGRTLIEEAGLAFKPLLDMRAEIQSLEERLGDDAVPESEHESMLSRYSDLQESFRRLEGYSIDLKITTVLRGLGFTPEDFGKASETFSGGWQMRIALAKLLLGRPGLLLLDEPTNHLDLESREALEAALDAFPGTLLLVSHDRALLDAVATRMLAVEDGELVSHDGGWADLVRRRMEADAQPEPAPKRSVRAPAEQPRQLGPTDLERIEAEITAREERITALERSLADEWSDVDLIAAHRREREELQALLERWEGLFEDAQTSQATPS